MITTPETPDVITIERTTWVKHIARRAAQEGDTAEYGDGYALELIMSATAIAGEEATDGECIEEIEDIIRVWRIREKALMDGYERDETF